MKLLTSKQCINKLQKFIAGTKWEADHIEWGIDKEIEKNYIWNVREAGKNYKIVCDKETGEIEVREV
jgi:hypothetical protein